MIDDVMYDIARQVSHEHGLDWTDPRTGKLHPAPQRYPLTCHACRHQQHARGPCERCGAPAEEVYM